MTAYVVPVLPTDMLAQFPRSLLELFTPLVEVSAGFLVIGIICGSALPRFKVFHIPFSFAALNEPNLLAFTSRRAIWLGLLSIVGMSVSFRVMGFIPMFVSDPMVAKYLRGSYQQSYRQVAVLFRASEQIIVVTLPIMMVLYYVTRRWVFMVIALLQLALQALTLDRGGFGMPVLMGVGLISASRSYKAFGIFLAVVVFGVMAASSTTYYAARMLAPQVAANDESTLWEHIASGAPDLIDTLDVMAAFERRPEWTYGRTFVGGLVPFHYRWNPSIWSLAVENSDTQLDVDTEITGGLRLPPPVMGYTAFGWPGAVIVCFLSGLAAGYGAAFGRAQIGRGSLLQSVIALTLYSTVIFQLTELYTITIYNVFSIFVALTFVYPILLIDGRKGAMQVG